MKAEGFIDQKGAADADGRSGPDGVCCWQILRDGCGNDTEASFVDIITVTLSSPHSF